MRSLKLKRKEKKGGEKLFCFVIFTAFVLAFAFGSVGVVATGQLAEDEFTFSSQRNSLASNSAPGTLLWLEKIYKEFSAKGPAKMTFFNVGHGDATLIEHQGKKLLIDTGGREGKLANRLLAGGIKKLDYLVITHRHPDHIGGLGEIRSKLLVEKLINSGTQRHQFFLVIDPRDRPELHFYLGSEDEKSLIVLVVTNGQLSIFAGDNSLYGFTKTYVPYEYLGDGRWKQKPLKLYVLEYPHHGVRSSKLEQVLHPKHAVFSIDKNLVSMGIPFAGMEAMKKVGAKNHWTANGDVTLVQRGD